MIAGTIYECSNFKMAMTMSLKLLNGGNVIIFYQRSSIPSHNLILKIIKS